MTKVALPGKSQRLSAVVVGAGLSGLAAALLLKRRGFYDVTVLEKRSGHTRANFVLLNHLGACRLRELGVYDTWKAAIGGKTEYCDQVYLKGNIQELIAGMKFQGILKNDAPPNEAQFGCLKDLDSIIDRCASHGVPLETGDDAADRGMVTSFDLVPHEVVVSLHDQGTGIEFAHINELEQAMAKLAGEVGIRTIYNCGDVQLVPSSFGDSVQTLLYQEEDAGEDRGEDAGEHKGDAEVEDKRENMRDNEVKSKDKEEASIRSRALDSPDFVVVCEGPRRRVATQQLHCKEVKASISQWYTFFEVDRFYGPDLFLVINETDEAYPDARLRHFACGGIQGKHSTFFYFQVPAPLAMAVKGGSEGGLVDLRHACSESPSLPMPLEGTDEALEAFIWKHLEKFASWHDLEMPSKILSCSAPFESRETYLESPCFGRNALVIGDASRSGSFQSGVGYNMILVNDLAAVDAVAQRHLRHETVTEQFMDSVAKKLQKASEHFHKINLERYY